MKVLYMAFKILAFLIVVGLWFYCAGLVTRIFQDYHIIIASLAILAAAFVFMVGWLIIMIVFWGDDPASRESP